MEENRNNQVAPRERRVRRRRGGDAPRPAPVAEIPVENKDTIVFTATTLELRGYRPKIELYPLDIDLDCNHGSPRYCRDCFRILDSYDVNPYHPNCHGLTRRMYAKIMKGVPKSGHEWLYQPLSNVSTDHYFRVAKNIHDCSSALTRLGIDINEESSEQAVGLVNGPGFAELLNADIASNAWDVGASMVREFLGKIDDHLEDMNNLRTELWDPEMPSVSYSPDREYDNYVQGFHHPTIDKLVKTHCHYSVPFGRTCIYNKGTRFHFVIDEWLVSNVSARGLLTMYFLGFGSIITEYDPQDEEPVRFHIDLEDIPDLWDFAREIHEAAYSPEFVPTRDTVRKVMSFFRDPEDLDGYSGLESMIFTDPMERYSHFIVDAVLGKLEEMTPYEILKITALPFDGEEFKPLTHPYDYFDRIVRDGVYRGM